MAGLAGSIDETSFYNRYGVLAGRGGWGSEASFSTGIVRSNWCEDRPLAAAGLLEGP